jgi:rare lipoprotein A (peptidoglycan hydrolase)
MNSRSKSASPVRPLHRAEQRIRIVAVGPEVADKLDMKKSGITAVEVAPIVVLQRDGPPKVGASAANTDAQELEREL